MWRFGQIIPKDGNTPIVISTNVKFMQTSSASIQKIKGPATRFQSGTKLDIPDLIINNEEILRWIVQDERCAFRRITARKVR